MYTLTYRMIAVNHEGKLVQTLETIPVFNRSNADNNLARWNEQNPDKYLYQFVSLTNI